MVDKKVFYAWRKRAIGYTLVAALTPMVMGYMCWWFHQVRYSLMVQFMAKNEQQPTFNAHISTTYRAGKTSVYENRTEWPIKITMAVCLSKGYYASVRSQLGSQSDRTVGETNRFELAQISQLHLFENALHFSDLEYTCSRMSTPLWGQVPYRLADFSCHFGHTLSVSSKIRVLCCAI